MTSHTVLTSDKHHHKIPSSYAINCRYFKMLTQYHDLSTYIPEVEPTLKELRFVTIPVSELNYNQVITAHPIHSFFQHTQLISDIEAKIIQYWLNKYYRDADGDTYQSIKKLVNLIVATNPRCAVKIYLRHRHLHNNISTMSRFGQDRFFWSNVRRQIIEYVDSSDVILISNDNHYTFDQCYQLVERLNSPMLKCEGLIKIANNYRNLINGWPVNNEVIYDRFLEYLRYQDLDNPVVNTIYLNYIANNVQGRTISNPIPYKEVIDNLRRLVKNDHREHHNIYHIFNNPDLRVIERVISDLARLGIIPNSSHLHMVLVQGSPAALKLLGYDSEMVIKWTTRLDSFLAFYNDDVSYDFSHSKTPYIGWYCILHQIKIGNQLDCIIQMIDNYVNEFEDILHHPEIVPLIPVIRIFNNDRELAHLIAEMGGRLKLSDLIIGTGWGSSIIPLNDDLLEFMITYNYQFSDVDDLQVLSDIQYITNDDSVIERLYQSMGILSYKVNNYRYSITPLLLTDALESAVKMKPNEIHIVKWIELIRHVIGYNDNQQLRYSIRGALCNLTVRQQERVMDRLAEYIQLVDDKIEVLDIIRDMNNRDW